MKWTGWSWEQYLECPQSVADEIIKVINEEVERYELAKAGL